MSDALKASHSPLIFGPPNYWSPGVMTASPPPNNRGQRYMEMWPGLGVWQVHTCVIGKEALGSTQVELFRVGRTGIAPVFGKKCHREPGPNNTRQK